MKTRMTKILAIVIAVIMVIGIVPMTVSASDSTPEPPVNAYISEITDTTMTIAWTASSSESVVKYEIYDWDTGEVYGETTGTTYTVEGLNPNTKYYIAVWGITATGIESPSAIVSDTTRGSVTLYFKPNANWSQGDARFAAYVYDVESAWVDLTELESNAGYYRAAFTDNYTKIIFCRMNPAKPENDWTNVWQQTIDLIIPTDGNNCLSHAEGSWNGGSGTWSYFEPTVAIETQETASARVSASNPGLRFKTKIHKAYLEQLIEAYGAENVSVGTLITPADILGNKDFTHELGENGVAYIDVAASIGAPFGTDGDFNVYAGSIVNIKKGNLDRDFSAVGYIKIVDGDNVYYEYSESIATRNVSEIAKAALEDTSATKDNKYANEVEVGVYSPYTAAQREILEGLVAPTVIDTYDELQAAVNAGGNVTLGGNIDMGDSWLDIPEGVRVTLDLAGFTLSGSGMMVIDNLGTLTVSGGTVSTSGYSIINDGTLSINSGTYAKIDNRATLTVNGGSISGDYAIYFLSGTTKLVGNNFTLGYYYNAAIFWDSSDAKIDLSEYTGESLKIESREADMPLENIILPEGWKLYDTSDNEIVATVKFGTIIAKPAITGGGEEEEEEEETTVVTTFDELQTALSAGGNVKLGGNIDIGENYLYIPEGVTVNLDLAGFTLSGSGMMVINNLGTLTVSGGTVSNASVGTAIQNSGTLTVNGGTFSNASNNNSAICNYGTLTVNGGAISGDYAMWASAGTTKFVGNNFTLSSNYNSLVYWSSNDAKIDLSEYTGESFKFESAKADMPLENITLPEGWKLYDTSDNEIVATVKFGTIIAKPAITGGEEEEEDEEPTVVTTYDELQTALNSGGNVTLGGNIDIGENYLYIPEGVTVNLDLGGFTLSSSGNIVVSVSEGATLTVSNGTVSNSDNNTIYNSGTLTLTDVDVVGSYNNSIVNNSGQLTVNGGSVTNGSQNGRVSINANTNTNVTLTGDVKLTGFINYSITHNPLIDLSECTDKAVITVQSAAGGNLPLANITLPTGWKFYDDDGNEITEELGNGVITVKPAIAGGGEEEEEETTVVTTFDELQTAIYAGGGIKLGGNIDMGNNYLNIVNSDTTVTLDLAGFTLSTNADGAIYISESLILKNGTVSSNGQAIWIQSGMFKPVGNSLILSGGIDPSVTWASSDAKIDLSEYTGESFKFESSKADMPLENITLPEGWKLYDTEDNELVATVEFGTIIAKPAAAE